LEKNAGRKVAVHPANIADKCVFTFLHVVSMGVHRDVQRP